MGNLHLLALLDTTGRARAVTVTGKVVGQNVDVGDGGDRVNGHDGCKPTALGKVFKDPYLDNIGLDNL
jgi:hypothetical protein